MSLLRYLISASMLLLLTGSCFTIRYDLSGGVTIDPSIKTVSVQYFTNRATLVNPNLSQDFTDKLKSYLESNTKLRVVNTIGDVDFSGEIKGYSTAPIAVSAGETAAKIRFTITIRVKYTNAVNPDDSWDQEFSQYRDYDSGTNFSQVESGLSDEILDDIIEQIFNKAFVNW
jgi:hypothetical protein